MGIGYEPAGCAEPAALAVSAAPAALVEAARSLWGSARVRALAKETEGIIANHDAPIGSGNAVPHAFDSVHPLQN